MTVVTDPVARLRAAADTDTRMVVVPRAALAAVLDGAGTGGATDGRAVFLTLSDADVDALAEAAWTTATDPSYVERYGPWGSNTTDHAAHHRDAARRTIAHLIKNGKAAT